ncbi:MAG: hypothetical protein FJ115_15375 [Deltaproteobacteria bacterium]|nr:hypothetical protein [Deltaproteobacteria bacterium]
MGRAGIAMTFVTDEDLGVLNSLLKTNRIDPVWHGDIPNLRGVHKPYGKPYGKKILKKRFQPASKAKDDQAARVVPTSLS